MSWEKRIRSQDLILYPGRQEVEKYVYTPGLHGKRFAEALREGKILVGKCGDTIVVPPKTYCPDFSEEELVELPEDAEWEVVTYTVITRDMYGNRLEKPQVVAVLRPLGSDGPGMIHYVDVEPDKIYPGMSVKPVFRPKEERRGVITDILYFKPST